MNKEKSRFNTIVVLLCLVTCFNSSQAASSETECKSTCDKVYMSKESCDKMESATLNDCRSQGEYSEDYCKGLASAVPNDCISKSECGKTVCKLNCEIRALKQAQTSANQ